MRSAVVLDEAGTRVAWRAWRLRPEWSDSRSHRPLLTGLLGFPWRSATLDARCLNRDPAPAVSGVFERTVDRHHRRVPAPGCTCGIYASLADLDGPPDRVAPRRATLAVGFVALSGRLVADAGFLRAQRATIIGPLALVPARRMMSRADGARPERVVVERDRYRVAWRPGRSGMPYAEWHGWVRHELAARYGVHVALAA